MTTRRQLLRGLAAGALAAPLVSIAQAQSVKIPRIAFLAGGSRAADGVLLDSFWRRMKTLGYVEGKNIAAEYRFAEGAVDKLPAYAAELVRLNVDVIIGPGSGASAASEATQRTPIVLTHGDPLGSGLVASLARPGGNVTGLSSVQPEIGAKQLEVLKEVVPRVARVAVLGGNDVLFKHVKAAADTLRVTLQRFQLRTAEDLEPAFAALKAERADAIVIARSPITSTLRARIVGFASQNRLPAAYPDAEFVEAGGLMSYGVSVADLWGRAANYVDKILKGAKPGDLPVEQPTQFELVINMKTAKALGVTVPPSLLLRASKVIE